MPQSVSSNQTVGEISPPSALDVKEGLHEGESELQFPEGGMAAWCMVVGGALVQFCGFGYTTSFGVYQDFYTLHYLTDQSPSAISWIGSMNAFLVTNTGLISGALYDRGYFYHLFIGGSLLQSFALFMLSLARPGQYYQVFLAYGVAFGLGQGLLYIPSMAVVSHYFHRRRTLAMSLVASGSSLGAIIHPIMLNNLFNRGVGFANGVRISAALVSVLLFIACILIRPRLEPSKNPANYLSVGKAIAHDMPFCIMCFGLLLFHLAFFFPLFYLQLDSVRHQNPETFSFYSLVLLNGGSFIGRLSTGFIASHISVPKLTTISIAACGILMFGMIGLDSIPSVVILGILFGYFAGIYIALLSPIMTLLTSDMSELGARMGVGLALVGVGNLVGGPMVGALLTPEYKWLQASLTCGFIALVASSFLILMQVMLTHRDHSSKSKEPETGITKNDRGKNLTEGQTCVHG